jgi:hypothetical protein
MLADLRRAQTVGIMLSRFKLPLDAVARAIRRMDARALTLEDVQVQPLQALLALLLLR